MNLNDLTNTVKQELTPKLLLPNLINGSIFGFGVVIATISYAFLVFSGDLVSYRSTYVGFALLSSSLIGWVVAIMSSSYVISGVQNIPAAICAVLVAAISTQMPTEVTSQERFITVVATLGLTTLLTGVLTWIVGYFKLGNLLRYIPHPVVGGFLAGSGWLLLIQSFNITVDVSLTLENLPTLLEPDHIPLWLSGIVFAITNFITSRLFNHWALTPGSILATIALFYLSLLISQTSVAQAALGGWLVEIPDKVEPWRPLTPDQLIQVDWVLIFNQIEGMLAVSLLTIIAVLLSTSAMEVLSNSNINANQELKAVGLANCLVGLGGGLAGYHYFALSIGARSRLMGIIASTLPIIVLIIGPAFIGLVPKFLLGGLMASIGLSLLVEWLYDGWFKLSRSDYLNVIVILAVIIFVGFLQGIAYGIIVAVILFAINYTRTPMTRHTLSGQSYTSRVRRLPSQEKILHRKGEQIHILQLQGLLFFGTASRLLDNVQARLKDMELLPVKFIILDFRLVTGLDSSVITNFLKLKQLAVKSNFSLVLSSLSPQIEQQLQLGEVLGEADSIFHVFPDLDQGMAWCEEKLLKLTQMRRSRSTPLFIQLKASFPKPELVSTLTHSYLIPMELIAGETLFQQGAIYDGLYFLETGQISLIDTHPSNHQERVATYQRGTLIGERGLYQESTYPFTAIADCKSRLFFLPADALERMEQKHPQLASALHRFTVRSLVEQLDYREQEIQKLLK